MSTVRWHVGSVASIAEDHLYDLGEYATRADAIACGRSDVPDDEGFWIVEAILQDGSPDDPDFDPDMGIPFAWCGTPEFIPAEVRS